MSRSINDLAHRMREPTRLLIEGCHARGVTVVPYSTLRTPMEQAKLWRMTRGAAEISDKVTELRRERALFIAHCIMSVGPQYPGPGIKGHVTNAVPGQSWHNWGLAVDCYVRRNALVIWDGDDASYDVYQEVLEEVGLHPGPIWDRGHAQFEPGSPIETYGDLGALSHVLEQVSKSHGGL